MKPAQRALAWGLSLIVVVALHGEAWRLLSAVTPAMPAQAPAAPMAMAVDMVPAPAPPPPVVRPPPVAPPPVAPPPVAPAPVATPPPPLPPVVKPAPAPDPIPVPAPVAPLVDESLPTPPPMPPQPPKRPRPVSRPHPAAPRSAPPPPQAVARPLTPAVAPAPPPAPVPQAMLDSWQSRLLGRLLAFRRYPPAAAVRGEQGTVYLRVGIDGNGDVTAATLVTSSGYADLDAEAVAWVHRAAPLPPPPGGAPVTVVVPLRFQIDNGGD